MISKEFYDYTKNIQESLKLLSRNLDSFIKTFEEESKRDSDDFDEKKTFEFFQNYTKGCLNCIAVMASDPLGIIYVKKEEKQENAF